MTRDLAPVLDGVAPLDVERDADGGLRALRAGGHTYFERAGDAIELGDGSVRIRELRLPSGLLRHVRCGDRRWVERYEWDAEGRPTHVDGVRVERDAAGRVLACIDEGASGVAAASARTTWRYGYADGRLTAIAGPRGERRIARGAGDGPVTATSRLGLPPSYRRDALGRTWCVLGPDGEIVTTWLWDGLACFGRIDGPPGEPLAAAFTLDPSLTPIRVIGAGGSVVRVPRDAFGEGLLEHAGVPGLFGGVVCDGRVHTRARALDPRNGCWDRPDPWHGLPGDPRRAAGYGGPLPVEGPAGDDVTVCRGDPIGRADPTGEVSVGLILSDLFWSHPNNLLGIFGLDLTINFWGALFTGRPGRWFSFEGLSSSDAMGAFGMRRDGLTVYGDRAWTFQHLVFATEEHLDELKDARLFDPKGVWEPSLYGTVLVVRPAGGEPFVLRATNHETPTAGGSVPRAPGWTRAGGPAVAVVSGSLVPRFPSGALHFDDVRPNVRGHAATVVEAVAGGAPLPGVVAPTEAYRLELAEGDAPAVGARVVLRTAGPVTRIATVVTVDARDGKARVVVDPEPGDAPGAEPRLHAAPAPGATETLSPVAGSPKLLAIPAASAVAYAAGDAVRLAQPPGAAPLAAGAAVITAFEARVTLDANAPGGFAGSVVIHEAAARGGARDGTLSADRQTLTVAAGADGPGAGELILVTAGALALPARVGDDGTTLDRPLSGLPAGAVTWRQLARGQRVGARDTPPDAAVAAISYVPETLHRVPAAGSVLWIEGSGAPVGVRSVVAREREAIELDHDLPGNLGADYAVERFALGSAKTVGALQAQRTLQLSADPGPLNAAALELVALTGPAPLAGATLLANAALAGATLTATPAPAGLGRRPFPGQVAVVSGGGTVAPVVVKAVRLDVTFDRDIAATTTCRIVGLAVDGSPFDAVSAGHPNLVVLPRTTAGVRTEQPRLVVGEAIEFTPPGGATALLFRVTAVDGARVSVEGPANLPPAGGVGQVSRLVAATPTIDAAGTPAGTPVSGVAGNRRAAANAREWRFDVWEPAALQPAMRVGVDDGTTTQPARIDRVDAVAVELTAAPAGVAAATVDLAAAGNVAKIAHATRFAQSGALVVVDDALLPAAAGPNLVLAIALAVRGAERAGELGSGGVLVPNNLELELDRRASLVEHELRHTLQSAWWGPLLLGFFPLAALQAGFELGTDADLPPFTPYVAATVSADGGRRVLQISAPDGYVEGSKIQLSAAGQTHNADLPAPEPDGRFVLTLPMWVPDGAVFVRRSTDGGWNTAMRTIVNVGQILTHGGMLNLVAGSVWGGLFFLIGHGLHALGQIGDRTTYPGTIEQDGRAVRLADPARDVTGARQVVIIAGESQTVRAVASVDGLLVNLSAPVSARGAVTVAPFKGESPDSFWDWHDYFPASVPDPARPASLRLEPVNGDRLALRAHDRVQVRSGATSIRTNVSAVTGTGDAAVVELVDVPPGGGGPQPGDVQIAKITGDDPMGNWDSTLLNEMGMGWMRWAFDPYGQIQLNTDSAPGSFADVALRTVRYALGTQSWAAVPPGWWFWDNALKQGGGDGHLSQMEQDAASNSGDLYSTIARLQSTPTHVGDIGQYWVFEQFRERTSLQRSRGDAPGVALTPYPRLIPKRTAETAAANDVNKGAQAPALPPAPAAGPGDDVAGVFWSKAADPRDTPPAAGARNFPPADRGWVPSTPTMERAVGAYVAFTRPSGAGDKHRVTSQGLQSDEQMDRAAHDAGKSTVLFDLDIADVEVRVGGRVVAEGDTVELVATERARVSVDPGAERAYSVVVAAPPGAIAAGDPADRTIIVAGRAPVAPVTAVDVEVSRLHAFSGGAYATAALRSHPVIAPTPAAAVHLPGDIHVPVRRFSVTATTSLAARTAVDLDAATLLATALKPGEHCFLVVPTEVLPGSPTAGAPRYPGVAAALAAGMKAPGLQIDVEALPAALLAQIPAGGAFKLTVKAVEPPEAACELPVETRVGRGADTATLQTVLQVQPHFTLELPAAAVDNKVARGPAGGITLTSVGATPAAAVTVEPPGGVTATVAGNDVRLAVDAGAAQTARTITVTDAANAEHRARRTILVV